MAPLAEAFVRIRPDTRGFAAEMKKGISGSASTKAMTEEGRKQGGAFGAAATSAAKYAAGGLALALGASVKAAGDFQQKMSVLQTAAGETAAGLKTVSKGILDLAVSTGTSVHQLEDGAYQVEKAGYRGAAALGVLKAASQGAREEGASLESVTSALTSIMASYHLNTGNAAQVTHNAVTTMNEMKVAAGESKTTMEQFAGSLSTVLPLASQAGISFAQVGGALGTLTQHGTTANEATFELSNLLRNLEKPNNVARNEMEQLGLVANDVAQNVGKRGLTGTLELLITSITQHMGPAGAVLLDAFNQSKTAAASAKQEIAAMPPELAKIAQAYANGSITSKDWIGTLKGLPPVQAAVLRQFAVTENRARGFTQTLRNGTGTSQTFVDALAKMTGGALGMNAALQLTGENMPGFQERVDKIAAASKNAGTNIQGWDVIQHNFNFQLASLRGVAEKVAITVGTKLLPALTSTFQFLLRHETTTEVFIGAMGVLAGEFVLAAVASKTWAIAQGIGTAATIASTIATRLSTTTLGTWLGVKTLEGRAWLSSTAGAVAHAGAMRADASATALAGTANTGFLAKIGLLGRFGLAAGAVAGLVAGSRALGDFIGKAGTGAPKITALAESMRYLGQTGVVSGSLLTRFGANLGNLSTMMQRVTDPSFGQRVSEFATKFASLGGILGPTQSAGLTKAQNAFKSLDASLASLVSSGHAAEANAAFRELVAQARLSGTGVDRLKSLLPQYSAASATATAQTNAFKNSVGGLSQKLDQLNGGVLAASQAELDFRNSTSSLTASLKTNAGSLSLSTQAGRDNRAALIAAAQAALAHAEAAGKNAAAQHGEANGVATANAVLQEDRKQLIAAAVAAGLSEKAATRMIDTYFRVPKDVSTGVHTPGLKTATTDMSTFGRIAKGIDGSSVGVKVNVTGQVFAAFDKAATGGAARAIGVLRNAGGSIPGVGSSDTVPAMLTPGEEVIRKPAAERNRALLQYINAVGHKVDIAGDTSSIGIGIGRRVPLATGGTVPDLGTDNWLAPFYAQVVHDDHLKHLAHVAHMLQLAQEHARQVASAKHLLHTRHTAHAAHTAHQRHTHTGGHPRSPLAGSAHILARYMAHGGHPEEDLSYRGMPRGYRFSALANAFYGSHRGINFGPARFFTTLRRWLSQRFARGGTVLPMHLAAGGSIPAVQDFIRSTDRLPYIWGGAGPGGYDCSGLVGAVYGKLTGKGGGHGERYFTTGDEQNFFAPGTGAYTVGFHHGNPGHTAGNLGGLAFEARSTATGIFTGSSAKPVTSFPIVMHLEQLGGQFVDSGGQAGFALSLAGMRAIDTAVAGQVARTLVQGSGIPFRTFDSGGFLPTGLSMAYNGTGRPEKIIGPGAAVRLHPDDLDALADRIEHRVSRRPVQLQIDGKTLDYRMGRIADRYGRGY